MNNIWPQYFLDTGALIRSQITVTCFQLSPQVTHSETTRTRTAVSRYRPSTATTAALTTSELLVVKQVNQYDATVLVNTTELHHRAVTSHTLARCRRRTPNLASSPSVSGVLLQVDADGSVSAVDGKPPHNFLTPRLSLLALECL